MLLKVVEMFSVEDLLIDDSQLCFEKHNNYREFQKHSVSTGC